jgi:membrane associated rhomboid family serine protease
MFPVSDVIPSRSKPVVTVVLMAITMLVFVYELQLDAFRMHDFARTFGVVPAQVSWMALVTGLFVHDGWIQLGANMVCLWIFGDNVEDAAGHAGFLLFYLASGLGATLVHVLLYGGSTAPLMGANAAIAAVMAAYFVLYPRSQVLTALVVPFRLHVFEVPAIFLPGIWLVLQLVSRVSLSRTDAVDLGLAFTAHVAGAVLGVIAGIVLKRRQRPWD